MNNKSFEALDLAYTKRMYLINMNSPLLLAIDMMTSHWNIYRLTVVDSRMRVKGVLSCLKILDTLVGRRGEGMKSRAGKGIEPLFRQPVRLLIDEYLHKLSQDIPLKGLISYIMENEVGHIVLVNQMNVCRGIITERRIINRLPSHFYRISISDLMTRKIYSITPTQTIYDAVEIMSSHGVRRLPIIEDKEIIGIVTARDLLNHFKSAEYHIDAILTKEEITEFMHSQITSVTFQKPPNLSLDSDINELIRELKETKQGIYPIIETEGDIVGIASSRDVVVKLPKIIGIDKFIELIQIEERKEDISTI